MLSSCRVQLALHVRPHVGVLHGIAIFLVFFCSSTATSLAQCIFVTTPIPWLFRQGSSIELAEYSGLTDAGQLVGWASFLPAIAGGSGASNHFGIVRANSALSSPSYSGQNRWTLTGGNDAGLWVGYGISPATTSFYLVPSEAPLAIGDVGLLWSRTQLTTLDTPLWLSSHPLGIDSKGNIAGTALVAETSGGPTQRSFKIATGASPDKATYPFRSSSSTVTITPGGRILGRTGSGNAVLSSDGSLTPLSGIQGDPIGMNDSGDIISFDSLSGKGYLLHNGVSTVVPGHPVAINNAGQILTYFTLVGTVDAKSVKYAITSCQPAVPNAIAALLGSGQTVQVLQATTPLVVRVTDAAGHGAHGITVNFSVASGSGRVSANSVPTEADGTAAVQFIASETPSAARVTASVVGLQAVQFQETVVSSPSFLTIADGDAQSGSPGTAFSKLLRVKVTDAASSPLSGVTVTFAVSSGVATLSAPSATTDNGGIAGVGLTAGTISGAVTVLASLPSLTAVQFKETVSIGPFIQPGGIAPIYSSTAVVQPGSWVSIYGSNLAKSTDIWRGDFPTSLGGTSVTMNGKSAYLWYVSPNQINLQAPDDTATGPVSVVVKTADGSATATVTLASAGPSFCLLDDKHVAGLILRSDGSGMYGGGTYDILGPTGTSLGYGTVAAKPGDILELFGVGLGPTDPIVLAGQPFSGAAAVVTPVQVAINGTSVTPLFAGLIGAGLYQVNVTVPAGVGSGEVSLITTASGMKSPSGVTIPMQ